MKYARGTLSHRISKLILLLPLAVTVGCSYCDSYSACDLRCSHTYPLTCEAVRTLPCGPAPVEYGYRTTAWSEWPGSASISSHALGERRESEPGAPTPASPPSGESEPSAIELPFIQPDPAPTEPLPIVPEPDQSNNDVRSDPDAKVSLATAVQPTEPLDSRDSVQRDAASYHWQPHAGPHLIMPVVIDENSQKSDTDAAVDLREPMQNEDTLAAEGKPRHPGRASDIDARRIEMRHYAPRRHAITLR